MEVHDTGDASELLAAGRLKQLGYSVLLPYGDNERYDVAIDQSGELVRIQVKTGHYHDGKIKFHCHSVKSDGQGREAIPYDDDEIDAYMVYYPDSDEFYWVSKEESNKMTMTLRIEDVEQNQPHINWADDYKLVDNVP